ncbi:hypothetical protein Tco_0517192 [Tanacetum coccineum]
MPSRANLIARGINISSSLCLLCEAYEESLDHCLINYPRIIMLWRKVWGWLCFDTSMSVPALSISDIAAGDVGKLGNEILNRVLYGVYLCVLWSICKWRNNLVHASLEAVESVRSIDIFPSIEWLSKVSISSRSF